MTWLFLSSHAKKYLKKYHNCTEKIFLLHSGIEMVHNSDFQYHFIFVKKTIKKKLAIIFPLTMDFF